MRVEDEGIGILDPSPQMPEFGADHRGTGPSRIDMHRQIMGVGDLDAGRDGVNAPIEVPPAHRITPAGRYPAALSARIAASSAAGSIAKSVSVATLTRLSCPIPATRAALSTEEWVCALA